MINTYPKVKKPDLPPLILPSTSTMTKEKGCQFPEHPWAPVIPPPAPSITKLNPTYTEDIISSVVVPSNRGKRIINWLKELKNNLPMVYRILIVVLIGLAIPIILPALGALPALGIA